MRRRPFQMSRRHRVWLYGAFTLCILSGAAWAVVWHFLRKEPDMALPAENRLMQAHLAGALAILVAVGSTLPAHASKSWKTGTNRIAGTAFLLALGAAVSTGYLILAFALDTSVTHYAHIAAGLAVVATLVAHILVGRRAERNRIAQKRPGTP